MSRDKEKARAYGRQYYLDHRDEISEKRKTNRPESAKIYREKNREEINAHNRAMYSANKEKEHARRKAYYESHKEKAAEYGKAKRAADTHGVREKNKIRQRKYRATHINKARMSCAAWQKENHEKCLTYGHERRARKMNNGIERFWRLKYTSETLGFASYAKRKLIGR